MEKSLIKKVEAREILDSRGNPTVEAIVYLADDSQGVAAVPSGASTGTYEAVELRDGGTRYGGKGVLKAVKNINNTIAKALENKNAIQQKEIDLLLLSLDGTKNKSKLGANAILAVSMACARAAANSQGEPLYKYIRKAFNLPENDWKMPLATMNVINGGRHADSGLSIQEFMIVPMHKQMSERIRIGAEIFHTLAKILHKKNYTTAVGDEGGFAPNLADNESALKVLMLAIKEAGYVPGKNVYLAMDMAASEFYKNKKYAIDKKGTVGADKIISILSKWVKKYPIVSIEDPLAEDDWDNWAALTKELGKKCAVVGDDLFVTNVERISKGIEMKVANAVLIKVNQIGSLSETIDAIYLAKKNKYKVSVSHRSGETSDTFIADLAVAVNADFIKTGSMSRSERVEKYNRLMKIESELK